MRSWTELVLLALDTALWSANNAHIDVLASGVFYKLGYRALAENISDVETNHGKPIPLSIILA